MKDSPTRGPAIVLLSGGMDSATVLAIARDRGHRPIFALTFRYGQRHEREVRSARALARIYGARFVLLDVPIAQVARSSLTRGGGVPGGARGQVPLRIGKKRKGKGIPPTYVPARNTIFLSLALALAESLRAPAIYLGVNAVDYSGYPDCRPEYLRAFRRMARLATARGVEGKGVPNIRAPLLHKTKAEIVQWGDRLGVPWELTWSCYRGGKRPCGRCDSCRLREKGFQEATLAGGDRRRSKNRLNNPRL